MLLESAAGVADGDAPAAVAPFSAGAAPFASAVPASGVPAAGLGGILKSVSTVLFLSAVL